MDCTLQIAICDDDTIEQNLLVHIIEQCGFPVNCSTFNSAEELLAVFSPCRYDLIIMDIFMTGMSGIDAVSIIRRTDDTVPVAFASASSDFTLESYRLGALKYIEKPVTIKPMQELLELALMKKNMTPHLNFNTSSVEANIPFLRIEYIEQRGHSLVIHLISGSTLQLNEKLDNISSKFEGHPFLRTHKSYLVNLTHVKDFDKELMVFVMKTGDNVHISRQNLPAARAAFEKQVKKSRES